jgi:hypothetical protein
VSAAAWLGFACSRMKTCLCQPRVEANHAAVLKYLKTPHYFVERFLSGFYYFLDGLLWAFLYCWAFGWNNGLREAVVIVSVFVLSTIFIQVPLSSYKLRFLLSIRFLCFYSQTCV